MTAVGAATVMGVEARPDLVHLGIASLLGELTVASILLRGARRSVQVATLGLAFQGIGWSAVSAAAGARERRSPRSTSPPRAKPPWLRRWWAC